MKWCLNFFILDSRRVLRPVPSGFETCVAPSTLWIRDVCCAQYPLVLGATQHSIAIAGGMFTKGSNHITYVQYYNVQYYNVQYYNVQYYNVQYNNVRSTGRRLCRRS